VSKYSLTASSPLNGAKFQLNNIEIAEITNLSIISIAAPKEGIDQLSNIISENYKTNLPDLGKVTKSIDNKVKFLSIAPNQFFLLYDQTILNDPTYLKNIFDDTAYYTDQSDGWVVLQAEGKNICNIFERICSINLSETTFPQSSVTRTIMEHIGIILYREETNKFVLFSARSSANSFYEMIINTTKMVI
tara:strand:+ start:27 stop:596 length:570 start_codon:yes stop_codon:yes gene_type:complete